MHGVFAPADYGIPTWPGIPVEVHYAADDPEVDEAAARALADTVRASGAPVTVHTYDRWWTSLRGPRLRGVRRLVGRAASRTRPLIPGRPSMTDRRRPPARIDLHGSSRATQTTRGAGRPDHGRRDATQTRDALPRPPRPDRRRGETRAGRGRDGGPWTRDATAPDRGRTADRPGRAGVVPTGRGGEGHRRRPAVVHPLRPRRQPACRPG